ncbi:N-acetylmuramoyl-L-alanine amidase [Clostridium ganghwense]|uniref:N-acetylmuramoyl-L-alanine amidase n=1 Tax=Clostridium ganghwense TaxID=312089 RepID=A0ABT4CNJ9_9CLOT|nr:N-acetylmuramoyl-L-alanine amidase [Clostridium ganghwense]MCY6370018.1 N-acetylmuramoyl-L-alanine amidase [Clostridium ganghwense]
MRIIRRIGIFMILMLFIGVSMPPNVFAGTYFEMDKKINIDVDRVWTIKFNHELDRNSINGKDNIVILDDKNSKVNIKIDYKDSRSVLVSAVNGYEYGKTYTLIVKEGIKSKKGSKMSKASRMIFTTKVKSDKPIGQNGYIVALDAGRAGNDVGAEVGPSGVKGKDINLDVVLKAGKILENNGVKVIYTRKSDMVSWSSKDSISARSKIVNDGKADVLVSVHCNSAGSTATGLETYYLKANSESKKLASYVQNELANKTSLPNRGIKESTYKTLSTVNATGVYVDLGFITNPTEEKIMNSEEFKKNSANAISSAVLKYLDVKRKTYIKDIKDITVLLYKGENYTLPVNLRAVMSDNTEKNVSVKWNKSYVDTSKIGTYYYKGTVSGYDETVNLKVIVNSSTNPDISKINKVCIDAASASNLKGLIGPTGVKDKDINLAIALKLGKILEKNGIKVTYTRKTDSVSWNEDDNIDERVKIANDSKSELLVSIRSNYYSNPASEGIETYYLSSDTMSKSLAENIQKNIIFNTSARSRGTKEAQGKNLNLLEQFDGVGIVAYTGFISNAKEEKLLNSSQYQDKIAKGIADSILNDSDNDDYTIVSVKDIMVNLTQGENYLLPTRINAVNSQNKIVPVNVIWTVNSIDTSEPGIYTIQGRVKNYNKPVNINIVVSSRGAMDYTICIDPGHGGYDSGAVGPNGTLEKDVALEVSLKLGDILVRNGINVVYTRTSDNTPWPANKMAELKKRCQISDEANADYFVSIHANSIDGSPATSGIETLYGNNRTDGIQLARNIQEEIVAATGGNDRGLKERGVYVVKHPKAPPVLVELEFLSNPEKEKLLTSPEYQQKCAEGIARGIMKTLR